MSILNEFVDDYQKMSPSDFSSKWFNRYNDIPTADEVITFLKKTSQLDIVLKVQGPYYLEQRGSQYIVFPKFRGMEIHEKFFDTLEGAARHKLDLTISSI